MAKAPVARTISPKNPFSSRFSDTRSNQAPKWLICDWFASQLLDWKKEKTLQLFKFQYPEVFVPHFLLMPNQGFLSKLWLICIPITWSSSDILQARGWLMVGCLTFPANASYPPPNHHPGFPPTPPSLTINTEFNTFHVVVKSDTTIIVVLHRWDDHRGNAL